MLTVYEGSRRQKPAYPWTNLNDEDSAQLSPPKNLREKPVSLPYGWLLAWQAGGTPTPCSWEWGLAQQQPKPSPFHVFNLGQPVGFHSLSFLLRINNSQTQQQPEHPIFQPKNKQCFLQNILSTYEHCFPVIICWFPPPASKTVGKKKVLLSILSLFCATFPTSLLSLRGWMLLFKWRLDASFVLKGREGAFPG